MTRRICLSISDAHRSLPPHFLCKRKHRLEAVLTADYVNKANSEARFQGKRSLMRLLGGSGPCQPLSQGTFSRSSDSGIEKA